MSHGKHFTLYTHVLSPYSWKCHFLLEELDLSYEPVYLDFTKGEQKTADFLKFNPNGRIPALVDHKKNDFVTWESCAIILYISEQYDPDNKFSASTNTEKYQLLPWLFFQASGQGPPSDQLGHLKGSSERDANIPSIINKYTQEVLRVLGVLESVLSTREWLVGDKMTVADMSFIPWNALATFLLSQAWDFSKDFPNTYAWHMRMVSRPIIAGILAEKMTALERAYKY